MKKHTVIEMVLILMILWGCNTLTNDDSSGDTSGGTTTRPDTTVLGAAPVSTFDGNWRAIYAYDTSHVSYTQGGEVIYEDPGDSDGPDIITDSSVLAIIKGDSITVYWYEEADGDTFSMEYLTYDVLSDFDTGWSVEDMKEEIYRMNSGDSVQFTINAAEFETRLISLGDTLTIEFIMDFDIDYTVQTSEGVISGNNQVMSLNTVRLVKYPSVIPPEDWPENFVVDSGADGDTNGDTDATLQAIMGTWQADNSNAKMKIDTYLTVSFGQIAITEYISEIYVDTNNDGIVDDTLTGTEMDSLLTSENITNPEANVGTVRVEDGNLSILWEGSSVPEIVPYSLSESSLTLTVEAENIVFTRL